MHTGKTMGRYRRKTGIYKPRREISEVAAGCVMEQLQSIKATGAMEKEEHPPLDLWLKTGRDQLEKSPFYSWGDPEYSSTLLNTLLPNEMNLNKGANCAKREASLSME